MSVKEKIAELRRILDGNSQIDLDIASYGYFPALVDIAEAAREFAVSDKKLTDYGNGEPGVLMGKAFYEGRDPLMYDCKEKLRQLHVALSRLAEVTP